jgi:hypothetical protein
MDPLVPQPFIVTVAHFALDHPPPSAAAGQAFSAAIGGKAECGGEQATFSRQNAAFWQPQINVTQRIMTGG